MISLREREFVEAARASGAGLGHILFRQLLPNLWAPILVSFSLAVPAYITGEAALSFLGIGMLEPTPDFGRMIYRSLDYLQTDPAYVFFPGITIFAAGARLQPLRRRAARRARPEVVPVGARPCCVSCSSGCCSATLTLFAVSVLTFLMFFALPRDPVSGMCPKNCNAGAAGAGPRRAGPERPADRASTPAT